MNKSDIIDKIRADAGLTIAQATMALQAVEHGITEALAKGESVKIVGFGAFETAERKAREGRNPKTGEAIQIPASTRVKFKAGKGLKEAVN